MLIASTLTGSTWRTRAPLPRRLDHDDRGRATPRRQTGHPLRLRQPGPPAEPAPPGAAGEPLRPGPDRCVGLGVTPLRLPAAGASLPQHRDHGELATRW